MAKDSMMVSMQNRESSMVNTVNFFVIMLSSAVVIAAAHQFFPSQVVLGTMSISWLWAVILSSAAVSVISNLVMPLFFHWEVEQKRILTPMEWMAGYLFINIIGLYAISRFAEIFGLGFSSWLVIVIVAVVLDLVQGMAMMASGEMMKKK